MKLRNVFFIMLSFALLSAATPRDSGYGDLPQKGEALGSNQSVQRVQEDGVRPEEVYKHGVQEYSLVADDTGYFPSRIYVRRNIPVRLYLTSASSRSFCFMMDDFSIRKAMPAQQKEEVRFLPTKSGQYKFYCPIDQLEGTIVVRD